MGILGTPMRNYDSPYQETDFFVLYHSLDASPVVLFTLCFCQFVAHSSTLRYSNLIFDDKTRDSNLF